MMGAVLMPHPCLQGPAPFVMAHRGFDLDGLENSMRAFDAAVRLGVTFLETDVQATADGVLVAFHDAHLDRVTDGRGRLAELPWRQVRTARIGGVEPIPRLEEVLAAWPRVRLNVDLKSPGTIVPFVQVIRQAQAQDRVVVASFSDRRRTAAVNALQGNGPIAWSPGVRGMARVLTTSASADPGRPRDVARMRQALAGAACVQVPPRVGGLTILTRRLVRNVHAAGAQLHVWTIDNPAQMRHLLDLGVDAIMTNRSDLAVQVLRERATGDPQGSS